MPFKAVTPAPQDHLIWDMVLPLAPVVGNDFALLARFLAAGHSYVSLTIAGDDCALGEALHRLAGARAAIARWPDRLQLVESVDDVLAARAAGKLAVGLHLEGTECLERDADVLDAFYALGIRHGILAFNMNNSAAGGCADVGDVGISRLGNRYLDRMAVLGMLLDCSHMSERSSMEAIDRIGAPAVFTHSNAKGLHDHYRNVSDAQARAAAASGGLVGVSGSSIYLGDWPTLAQGVFRQIDYLVQLLGPAHVGLGTDYVADAEAIRLIFAERPDEWPTEGALAAGQIGYLPPEDIGSLITQMRRAGYDEAAVAGILGGNYVRIARAVWK